VIVVDLAQIHSSPQTDVVSSLVYSTQPSDVRTTIIDGSIVMRDRELLSLDESSVVENANREAAKLMARAGVSN